MSTATPRPTTPDGGGAAPTRPERMGRLPDTPKHTRVLLGSGTGWALDAMDVGLISFVGLAIATQWDLTRTEQSWLLSIGFVGMAIGATFGGMLADRYGRRTVFALTLVAALANLSLAFVVVTGGILLAVAAGSAFWLVSRAVVFHAGEEGYRVRFVRGAGAQEARWVEVEDAVTTHVRDAPCLVLRLKDGRTTTIPVEALAMDREQFVREVQDHLQRGHGLPPLRRRGS